MQQKRTVHYSSHLRVMNVDNATAAPSVLLFFDRERYLFNAGEGIQRHFFEHKQRLKKVTHVLATRVSTDTLAGLPGMLLSQVDPGADYGKAGGAQVAASVTGPAGLRQYVDAFRMYASSFALNVTELGTPAGNAPIVSEGRVTITPLLITPAAASSKAQPAGSKAAAAGAEADAAADAADGSAEPAAKKPRHEGPTGQGPAQPAAAASATGSNTRGTASVHSTPRSQQPVACYVCQFASIPGKFDPQKAAQLGVPKGPLFGQLQRGNPVTAVSGRVVQPHEVMNPPTMMGPCLIVVDCPSLDYLPALQADPTLQQLQQDAQQQQQQGGSSQPTADTPAAAAAGAAQEAGASNSQTAASESRLFVVVHLGPAGVSSSSEYSAWCAGFGRTAQQLFVSGDGQLCTTTRRAAQLQAQLNVIEPEVFSLQGMSAMKEQAQQLQQQQQAPPGDAPMQDAAEPAADAANAPGAGGAGSGMQVFRGAPDGLVYKLMPPRVQGLSQEEAITQPPDLAAIQAEVRGQHPKVMQLLQEYTAAKAAAMQQQPAPQLQGVDRQTAAVTPLGTCSACPSNHRNVSAYYLDLFDRGGLLMDCGEDTMGQLERRYGRAEAERRILQLHAIWISHMHADHHGGLYPLLLRRQALLQQHHASTAAAGSGSDTADGRDQAASRAAASPLLIMGPFPLFRVLCQYSRVLPLSFTFLPNSYFFSAQARQPPAEALAAYEAVKVAAGLAVMEPFPVQHVANSSGLQLKAHRGWKMVFSGDTRPCQAVIDAARDATLLVHEATFEDELQQEAIMKKHSTTAEALGVAAAANAYRTLLTHFSTRYPKIPVMKAPADADAAGGQEGGSDLAAVGSVMVAFDLMTVNLADLPWLPKMLPVLDELLQEEEADYDDDEGADGAE